MDTTEGRIKQPDEIFCWSCGVPIKREAIFCVHCGVPAQQGVVPHKRGNKQKLTAVLLAVFLGAWTWIYTFKYDWWKFVLAWVPHAIAIWLWIMANIDYDDGYVVGASIAQSVGIIIGWIWPIIHTSIRSRKFYDNYPN